MLCSEERALAKKKKKNSEKYLNGNVSQAFHGKISKSKGCLYDKTRKDDPLLNKTIIPANLVVYINLS